MDSVIRIFVSAARSTARSQLGFDPSITCIKTEDTESGSPPEQKYEIKVHDNKGQPQEVATLDPTTIQTYTTARHITSSTGANTWPRITWVFEGIDEDNQAVVIKDTWVKQDQELEGSVLESVHRYLKTEDSEQLKYFLDPLCHGVVIIDGRGDVTPSLSPKTLPVSPHPLPVSGRREPGTQTLVTATSLQTATPINIDSDRMHHKHYRIAFKGKAGRALHELRSYREAFAVLLGGVRGTDHVPVILIVADKVVCSAVCTV